MQLPMPDKDGSMSLERSLLARRTVRSFLTSAIELKQFSQLCWAAQGITDERKQKRTAPSGGALYPLDVYAAVGDGGVERLGAGIYHYEPLNHGVYLRTAGDIRSGLAKASYGQTWMAAAPVHLVITAEYKRICGKYGERGIRYAIMEVGHVGQNIFLQAEATGLGAGIVGAFHDQEVSEIMALPPDHEPLLIMPIGYKKERKRFF
ncbi:MAG: nitroreductase [Deltaproteobacteria bacterium HGW-Deltaproteobacteria-15]|nr:MAG: nitroreductase [Deltaproteobacteria bacterium HGW-Deltaproteobacteria-15]